MQVKRLPKPRKIEKKNINPSIPKHSKAWAIMREVAELNAEHKKLDKTEYERICRKHGTTPEEMEHLHW
jgi:hypothetical protein